MQELGVLKKDIKIVVKNCILPIYWMYYIIQIKIYFKEFFSTYDQTRSYFRIHINYIFRGSTISKKCFVYIPLFKRYVLYSVQMVIFSLKRGYILLRVLWFL